MRNPQENVFSPSFISLLLSISLALFLPVLSAAGQPPGTGASISKDTEWANVTMSSPLGEASLRGGYVPVEVTIVPERVPITVDVSASSGYRNRGRRQTTSRTVRIKKKRRIEFTLYHPLWRVKHNTSLYVRRVGGEGRVMVGWFDWSSGNGPKKKLLRITRSNRDSAGELSEEQRKRVADINTKNAWANWKGYTAFDRVFTRYDELRRLGTGARRALIRWVANGGHLVLLDSPVKQLEQQQPSHLPDLDVRTGSGKELLVADHLFGVISFHGNGKMNVAGEDGSTVSQFVNVVASYFGSDSESRKLHVPWHERFGWREEDDAYTSPVIPGSLVISELVDLPIVSGLLILLGFSVLIGPLNYWYLRRLGKEPMMLLTIPAMAILATGLIFAWDIFKHGLGNDVRAHGIVRIDQRDKKAAHITRYMLYMGISPGQLSFPGDAAVTYLGHTDEWNRTGKSTHSRRSTEEASRVDYTIRENRQLLSGSPGQSRTPVFLDERGSEPFRGRLIAERTAPDTLRVTNSLGFPVHHLMLVDRQGRYYVPEDDPAMTLPTGRTETFTSVEPDGEESEGDLFQLWKRLLKKRDSERVPSFDFVPDSFLSPPDEVRATRYIGLTDRNRMATIGVSSFTENGSSYLIQGLHWDSESEREEK